MDTSIPTWRRVIAATVVALLLAGGAAAPARAQPSVDTLLSRVFGTEEKTPYELTADFNGTLTLVVRGAKVTAVATGSFQEFRRADGVKRRKVNITKLDLPALLQPFAGTVRRVIEEKVETQSESPETFHQHDIFIQGEVPGNRYMLIGVLKTIVDAAIDQYGRPEDKKDPDTRRRIARWLWSPVRRDTIVRSGPPYALRTVVDEAGTIYELTLFYSWGEVGTRITYVQVNNQPVWRTVSADSVSEVSGLGRVDGTMLLTFSNHCFNCKK